MAGGGRNVWSRPHATSFPVAATQASLRHRALFATLQPANPLLSSATATGNGRRWPQVYRRPVERYVRPVCHPWALCTTKVLVTVASCSFNDGWMPLHFAPDSLFLEFTLLPGEMQGTAKSGSVCLSICLQCLRAYLRKAHVSLNFSKFPRHAPRGRGSILV